jgi:hypothetical protein
MCLTVLIKNISKDVILNSRLIKVNEKFMKLAIKRCELFCTFCPYIRLIGGWTVTVHACAKYSRKNAQALSIIMWFIFNLKNNDSLMNSSTLDRFNKQWFKQC